MLEPAPLSLLSDTPQSAVRFGERLAALPQFVLKACREVWRDFGSPAPFRAADPPPKGGWSQPGWQPRRRFAGRWAQPQLFQSKKKHPITGTPRELGCCLLLPSHVHSRCQTRTLVLNLAGDEGCRVYTTHARARSPRHRQRQSLRLSLSQDSSVSRRLSLSQDSSAAPTPQPPPHRRQLTPHPGYDNNFQTLRSHTSRSLTLSLALRQLSPPVTRSPSDSPPSHPIPARLSPSQRLPAQQSLLCSSHSPPQPVGHFWVLWTPCFGACPTVTLQTLPGQLSGLERVWQPCHILCWRPVERFEEILAALPLFVLQTPPPADADSPAGSRATHMCWPVGSIQPFQSKKKTNCPSFQPRRYSVTAAPPPPVHSRCQTRTLVLNLAGDEGCWVHTTRARSLATPPPTPTPTPKAKPKPRQQQQHSTNPSLYPPPRNN